MVSSNRGFQNANRAGFTIVELIVTIGIITLLLALVMPAIQSSRAAARNTMCLNNLRQLGLALGSHESAFGALPQPTNCYEPDKPYRRMTSQVRQIGRAHV